MFGIYRAQLPINFIRRPEGTEKRLNMLQSGERDFLFIAHPECQTTYKAPENEII